MIKENFIIKNKDKELKATLELIKYGGFDYGNGNGLALNIEGGEEQLFDARYDNRFDNEKEFRKYAYEFVRDHIRKNFEVIKVNNIENENK